MKKTKVMMMIYKQNQKKSQKEMMKKKMNMKNQMMIRKKTYNISIKNKPKINKIKKIKNILKMNHNSIINIIIMNKASKNKIT